MRALTCTLPVPLTGKGGEAPTCLLLCLARDKALDHYSLLP